VGIDSHNLFAGKGFPVTGTIGDGLLIRDLLVRKKWGRAKKSTPGAIYKAASPHLRHQIKAEGFFINLLICITELTADIAIVAHVTHNYPSFHMGLLLVIKYEINNQFIPHHNLHFGFMAQPYSAEGDIDNPTVARHLAGVLSIYPVGYLVEKTLKIRLFPISFPEIQVDCKCLIANALYLQRVLLILKLGHRHMLHLAAMGAVEEGHIFLIDKNLGLTHAKKLLFPTTETVNHFNYYDRILS